MAIFELSSDNDYRGVWVVDWAGFNIFAILSQEPGQPWNLKLRTSIVVDDKLWGSADRKEVFSWNLGKDCDPAKAWKSADRQVAMFSKAVHDRLGLGRPGYLLREEVTGLEGLHAVMKSGAIFQASPGTPNGQPAEHTTTTAEA